MEKKRYALIKLNKMQEAYKFTELINILILNIGIFQLYLIKIRIQTLKWLILKHLFYVL
jgi:hypothetical protein